MDRSWDPEARGRFKEWIAGRLPAWEESEALYWETGHRLHVVVRDIQILPAVLGASALIVHAYGLRTPHSRSFRFGAPWDDLSVTERSVFSRGYMRSWTVDFEPEWLAGPAKLAAEPVEPGADKRFRLRAYYLRLPRRRWDQGLRESSFETPRPPER